MEGRLLLRAIFTKKKKRKFSFLSYQTSNRVREKYSAQFLKCCFPLAELSSSFFSILKLWLSQFYLYLQRKLHFWKIRSSRPKVFCKKGALGNFAKFSEKHLCQNFYSDKAAGLHKVVDVQPSNSLEEKLRHR